MLVGGIEKVAPLGEKWSGDTAYLACKLIALIVSEDWAIENPHKVLPGLNLLVARLSEEADDVWALSIVAVSKLARSQQLLSEMIPRGLISGVVAACQICTDT